MKLPILIISIALSTGAHAQQPPSPDAGKDFVRDYDSLEFKASIKPGMEKTYTQRDAFYYDVRDNSTSSVRCMTLALVYMESEVKNGKKNGITRQYLIDAKDHSKKYLIAQQRFVNDKLNGRWEIFNLKGTLIEFRTYKNDSLNGLTVEYQVDGKTPIIESIYKNGKLEKVIK